jgi:hypothetical protein
LEEFRLSFIDEWKEWSTTKKVLSIVVVCCIGLIIVGAIMGTFSPDKNTSPTTYTSSDSGNNNAAVDTAVDNSSNNDSVSTDTEKVYTDGTYKVGSDLPAGEYKFTQTSDYGGYVERSSDSSMELDSIISNEVTDEKGSTMYVTVNDGEYLKIQGGELKKS